MTNPRTSTTYKLGGTKTFRLGSSAILERWGCLLPSSEVLTKLGWKSICQVTEADEIMQWDINGDLTWCKAVVIVKNFEGEMIASSHNFHKHCYTPEHRIPVKAMTGKWLIAKTAQEVTKESYWKLPVAGNYKSGKLNYPLIRLAVMAQADANVDRGYLRIVVSKERKKRRLKALLDVYKMEYTEQSAAIGFVRYGISKQSSESIIKFLRYDVSGEKLWGEWLLDYDQDTLEVLIDELKYWDAHRRGNSFQYFTTVKQNAEWIATIAHLVGKSASIFTNKDNNRGYGSGMNKILYTVNIKPRVEINSNPSHFTGRLNYKGKVYCLVTDTSFFLTRHENCIVVTGNSNLQNIEKSNRKRFVPDAGKLFCQVDQAGAEALIVAHCMPRTNKLRQLFDNKIKIHNYLGVAFPEQWISRFPHVREFASIPLAELKLHPLWPEFMGAVAKSDENPPATRYYYHYKMVGHSANYGIQAATFIENLLLKSKGAVRLTRAQGEKYLEGYHSLIPELRGYYHRWVAKQYETDGILRNFQGFPIHITQRLHEHEYTKIYDKIPQSTVGCITHTAFTNLFNFIAAEKLDWDVLQNNHDSYLAQAPEGEIMQLAAKMKEFMEVELTSPFGEKFNMRSEVQIGSNWCPFKKDSNPDGLKEVKL